MIPINTIAIGSIVKLVVTIMFIKEISKIAKSHSWVRFKKIAFS